MRAVLSAAVDFAEEFRFPKLIARIPESVESLPGFFIHHHVEALECVEQSVRTADFRSQRLDFCPVRFADWRDFQPEQPAVLIAHNETTLRIDRHAHPRTLLLLGHRVEQFHFETRLHLQRIRSGGDLRGPFSPSRRERIAPRFLSVSRNHARVLEFRAALRRERPVRTRLDHQLFSIGHLDRQCADKRRDAVRVARIEAQFVFPRLQIFRDTRLGRIHPIRIVRDLRAIHKSGRAIVASEHQRRRFHRAVDRESLAESRALIWLRSRAGPDPCGLGQRGERGCDDESEGGKNAGKIHGCFDLIPSDDDA